MTCISWTVLICSGIIFGTDHLCVCEYLKKNAPFYSAEHKNPVCPVVVVMVYKSLWAAAISYTHTECSESSHYNPIHNHSWLGTCQNFSPWKNEGKKRRAPTLSVVVVSHFLSLLLLHTCLSMRGFLIHRFWISPSVWVIYSHLKYQHTQTIFSYMESMTLFVFSCRKKTLLSFKTLPDENVF